MSEYDFHCAVTAYLGRALGPECFYFHPANGGYRRASEAARLKAMGVQAGLPDLGVLYHGSCTWLELKTRKGRLSPAQAYCHRRIAAAGSGVAVCKTLEDVEAALRAAGIPIKARLL